MAGLRAWAAVAIQAGYPVQRGRQQAGASGRCALSENRKGVIRLWPA